MLVAEHTIETKVSPKIIWSIWEDVKNWNTWDYSIEFSTLNGPFKKNSMGTLKPKGGPLVHIVLTKVDPLQRFVTESKLPLTRIVVSHFLTTSNGITKVTHRVEMKGLLSFVFAFLIGRNMKKNLPRDMLVMAKKAESLKGEVFI